MALVMKLVGGPEGTAEKPTHKQQYTPAENGLLHLVFPPKLISIPYV